MRESRLHLRLRLFLHLCKTIYFVAQSLQLAARTVRIAEHFLTRKPPIDKVVSRLDKKRRARLTRLLDWSLVDCPWLAKCKEHGEAIFTLALYVEHCSLRPRRLTHIH